jgi:hypothetical protein
MKKTIAIASMLIAGTMLTVSAFAQREDAIELTRSVIQTQRQAIVADAMRLTDEEGERFWPLYREYQHARARLVDREIKMIKLYADNLDNLTDEIAEQILQEYFSIEKADAELKVSWAPRFKEVLTPIQVARFFQIENKLDAIVEFDLAKSIPLIQ